MKTLYRAARVYPFAHRATGEWVLVDGRHVERVGSGDPPAADRVVELPGATILPGFIDAHVHLTGTTLEEIGIPIDRARSAGEMLAMVADEMERGPAKLLAHGFDETRWERADLPTLDDLDGVASVPIILIRADGHVSLANSAALKASEAWKEDGVDVGGDGRPTGTVRRLANRKLQRWFHEALSEHELRELQLEAAGFAAARGITCIHEMAIPASHGRREVEVLMGHRMRLPVDVVVYVADADIPWVIDLGLEQLGGDLSLDGSIGARTASMSSSYEDGDGVGIAYEDDDELAELFHNAHLAGLQVACHAIGDAAIEQALRVWERVYGTLDSRQRRHFRARRHRVEHFELPNGTQVERAAALGLAISVQPAFDALWGHPGEMYERRLGPDRAAGMNPFGTLLARGLELGAGSDSPVTPLDPDVRGVGVRDPPRRLAAAVAGGRRAHLHGGKRPPGAPRGQEGDAPARDAGRLRRVRRRTPWRSTTRAAYGRS